MEERLAVLTTVINEVIIINSDKNVVIFKIVRIKSNVYTCALAENMPTMVMKRYAIRLI